MKAVIKIVLMGAVLVFAGSEMNAQEKKKKKPQDTEYMAQKQRMDAERIREAEEKRRSDSVKKVHYRDSMADLRRADSIKYSKILPLDSLNRPGEMRSDSLDKSAPKMNEGNEGTAPKGPNSAGVRRIDFGSALRPAEHNFC